MGQAESFATEVLDELRRWGGPAEMSAFESVMWRAEVDPRLRSTTTSVLMLDRVPDWDRFVADHDWLVRAVPRFRQRVVVPSLNIGHPTWIEDPEFVLDYHLRRIALPVPGSERQLFDLAQNLAMTPFDRARSPWEATLVEGLDGGRAAYILKLHHATADGLGIVQLLSRLFSATPDAAPRPAPPPLSHARRRIPSSADLSARQLGRNLRALPSVAAVALSTLRRSLGGALIDARAKEAGLAYLASAGRMLVDKAVPGSPLFRRRSLSWRFDGIELPLVRFKRAAKALDASVNDVFLSGMIGGFRRYHEEMGLEVAQMPIGFPISLRTADDPIGGNKFAGSQYPAPLSEPDPVARIRHIQAFVRDKRAEPALDVMLRLMPVVARLPLPVVTDLTASFIAAQDAQISNIPGIAHPVFFAGAEVTQLWPFAPASGCGMMIAMMSHNGRCCIGITSDRAAVMEPELLRDCFRAGLEEVLTLGETAIEPSSPPRARRKR